MHDENTGVEMQLRGLSSLLSTGNDGMQRKFNKVGNLFVQELISCILWISVGATK